MRSAERHALQQRADHSLRRWSATLPPDEREQLRRRRGGPRAASLIGEPLNDAGALIPDLQDLREFVDSHEELGFFLGERRFHICRAHPAALQVVTGGLIPAGFRCPAGDADCPFAAASAHVSGAPIRLRAQSPDLAQPE
jgi:hypothetical protein